jgi:CRP-like cAMP-binding protein
MSLMSLTRSSRSADPKAGLLRSALGLSAAPEREIFALLPLFDEVRLAPGELLMRQGEIGHELFLIIEGQAAVTVHDKPVATVGPGEFVGEMSLFERAPRSATVTAMTPVRTLVAGGPSFATLLTNALVLRRLAAALAHRLRTVEGSPRGWSG